jgi:hypothetical protein
MEEAQGCDEVKQERVSVMKIVIECIELKELKNTGIHSLVYFIHSLAHSLLFSSKIDLPTHFRTLLLDTLHRDFSRSPGPMRPSHNRRCFIQNQKVLNRASTAKFYARHTVAQKAYCIRVIAKHTVFISILSCLVRVQERRCWSQCLIRQRGYWTSYYGWWIS